MYLSYLVLVLNALLASAVSPTQTVNKRQNAPSSQFVTTDGGTFVVNGSTLNFVGTNADEDIDFTLGNMSAAGIKVVRTWAFNDVETIPENGTWFQLIANGTTTKLDTVIQLAEKHGIFVLLSLTNNWNPRPLLDNITANVSIQTRDVTPDTNNSLPRNTLSNDFGGMDVYVREFANNSINHDEFYTNPVILSHFMNYTSQIVSRYVNRTSVFSWEIANDPRCNSSLAASASCNTNTITQFHSTIADHIKSIDPNHLLSGFFCADCPKLFPRIVPPAPSPTPGAKRRATKPITKKKLLAERKEARKKARKFEQRNASPAAGGLRIRGRWMATETKRQAVDPGEVGVGSAFDGSQGVDSEDILNIPNMGFGAFQLFPDQNFYGVSDPTLPAFNNTVKIGLDWIARHAEIGTVQQARNSHWIWLVTQSNAPVFVPFNSSVPFNATQAPFGPDPTGSDATQPFGVTDQQRDDAYTQWLQAGLSNGLQGMIQYQWTQANLTTVEGTNISPTITGTGLSPVVTGPGFSPNDGYSLQGVGNDEAQAVGVISQAAQSIGPV
ncbi:glycoside hydrolase family 5 protein [Pholiota molesta]|nr:glycoside hydrolase family 5 protein [Pholiota molesta]